MRRETSVHLPGVLVVLLAGLLLYGNAASGAVLEPFLGIGAVGVLAAMLLMIFMVIKYSAAPPLTLPEPLSRAA